MLKRIDCPNGVSIYVSPLLQKLGVPHAFSTRIGGVSQGAFASLNLGNPQGASQQDDAANITENHRRLCQAAGFDGRRLRRVSQVHGCDVLRLGHGDTYGPSHPADGMISDDPSCVLLVRTADCVPILLASPAGRMVAAVHAGWRGVIAGVVPAAVQRMKEAGGDPSFAAIGPCIGFDAFEVGHEVLGYFQALFPTRASTVPPSPGTLAERRGECLSPGCYRTVPGGKAFIDLRTAVRRQLLDCGLANLQIDTTDRCTYQHADEFFSHRRDNGTTGRMAAFIGSW